LEKAGYTVTSAYTAVKDPEEYRFLYRDYLWTGADMVSLGVAAFGHFGGTHYQNEKDYDPYVERIGQGELPVHRALTMTDDEKLVRELILQLKLGQVKRDYFVDKFGVDIYERFSDPLSEYRDAGYLKMEGDRLVVTRSTLLKIDELLHRFYLPQHRDARYT
jgi:oxygen-independent coproporphyrinogen-3 oxidase